MQLSPQTLLDTLRKAGTSKLRVAFSGGVDSHVLLHLCCALREQGELESLEAVHVHHGLNEQADTWAEHCKSLCDKWQVPLRVCKVKLDPEASNLEALARDARYRALAEDLDENTLVLFAHHRNDQAETLLYRLMRGAGVRALSAMPQQRRLARGRLLRPLLQVSRQAIEDYAQVLKTGDAELSWVEDSSNQDLRFDRNFIRHQLLPLFSARWQQADLRLVRHAEQMSEDSLLLDELAELDLQALQAASQDEHYTSVFLQGYARLPIKALLQLSVRRQANLLRFWLRRHSVSLPGRGQLQNILSQLACAEDAQPILQLASHQLRIHQGLLVLLSEDDCSDNAARAPQTCRVGEAMNLDDGSRLEWLPCLPAEGLACSIEDCELVYRDAQCLQHLRFGVRGRRGSKSLKRWLQDYKVPVWLRQRVPLLLKDGQLLAAGGVFVCELNDARILGRDVPRGLDETDFGAAVEAEVSYYRPQWVLDKSQ